MVDYVKISELPAASSANLTDQLETNQAGTSRRITVSQLLGSGSFRLLQRIDVGSAVAQVDVQAIAADINDIMFSFDLTPVTNGVNLYLQMYDNAAALVNGAGQYSGSLVYATTAQAPLGAPAVVNSGGTITTAMLMSAAQTTRHVGNASGIRGDGRIANIRSARFKTATFATNYVTDDASGSVSLNGQWMRSGASTSLTGIRLTFSSGNIAAGGAFSVWGSP